MNFLFNLENYNYTLPEELIAQSPNDNREGSNLLVYSKTDNKLTDSTFSNLLNYLPKKALIIANNSKVMPARIFGKKNNGNKVEVLIMTPVSVIENGAKILNNHSEYDKTYNINILIKASKKIKVGEEIFFPNFMIKVIEKGLFGQHLVQILWQGSLTNTLQKHGTIPLPPYIKRSEDYSDVLRYQTVYAKTLGSVAAPTAGLHFTEQIQTDLLSNGFEWQEVTLHVGYGTFSPVRSEDIREHEMHAEYVEISGETAKAINKAKRENRPIIAIGTTAVRTLEGMASEYQKYKKDMSENFYLAKTDIQSKNLPDNDDILPECGCYGHTNIFIYPGKKFEVISGLVTNFHLPKSSLLMLVSAFAGYDNIMKIYRHAIEKRYRFFSYGDAMLIS